MNKKGITLIALVITIIVLLILAGVSLNLITGSDGILEKVSNATDQTQKSSAKEQVELLLADYKAEYFQGKYVDGTESTNPKEYAQNKLEPGVATNNYFAKATGDKVKVYSGTEATGKAVAQGTLLENGGIRWEEPDPLLEEANANPEKYRHPEQQTSTAIGIGPHGEPVNMDLWGYRKCEENSYELYAEDVPGWIYATQDKAYLGTDFENIIIPQYIKENNDEEFKPVIRMSYAFKNCTDLTVSPEIPSTVTDMQDTFYGCTSLTQAPIIPNSVTNMEGTFSGCTNLSQAPIIPNSVTNMSWTFYGCTSLTQAPKIPNSVTNMQRTFYGCTSLTQAPEIPSSVTNMDNTFLGCTNLTKAFKILASVTDMKETFRGCTSLTEAPEILGAVTNMSWTFYGCTSLTQAPKIPNSVTNMQSTFYGCTSLTQAPEIPSSVKDMKMTFWRMY